jgi:hypothetical protein
MYACGGQVDHGRRGHGASRPDAGLLDATAPRDAGASHLEPGASMPKLDASLVVTVDASDDASADAGHDPDATAADANACVAGGALAIAGDYVATDRTEYWLRKTATATTYTLVPPPPALPSLFRVTTVCTRYLALAGTDGTFARLDWVQGDTTLRVCVRPATSGAGVGQLSAPDGANAATGCGGAPWLVLTRAAP